MGQAVLLLVSPWALVVVVVEEALQALQKALAAVVVGAEQLALR